MSIRVAILLGGLILEQLVLFGPSLLGTRLLLPLECLKSPFGYLPADPNQAADSHPDWLFSDAVLQVEPDRVFATAEVRAGRLPFWNPYNYCGVPFLANNNSAVFSPFMIPSYLHPGPETLAWIQLLKALVAGIGAYVFFRRAVGTNFFPAIFGAWVFPLTGYMIMWSWIHHSSVVALLPWMLLVVDSTIRRDNRFGTLWIAILTAITLYSGKLDTSAQVLLASGFYACWCLVDRYRGAELSISVIRRPAIKTALGWGLGIMLAAPVVLPTREFLQSSVRIEDRSAGQVDFPPHGLDALLPILHPYVYGRNLDEFVGYGNLLESAALGYAGLLTALCLVPLGWAGPCRSQNAFWAVAALFALSAHVWIPGFTVMTTFPPLHLLQINRFAFLAAWCLVATAVNGLELLGTGRVDWRWWFWPFATGLVGLAAWNLWSLGSPPSWIKTPQPSHAAQIEYGVGALLCVCGVLWFVAIRWQRIRQLLSPTVIASCVIVELLFHSYGFIPQADPELYYPELPVLTDIENSEPGRICAIAFLLPSLNRMHGLSSIRGYDGADSRELVKLLKIANPNNPLKSVQYASTFNFVPSMSPVLRMLNLRYRIGRGPHPKQIEVIRYDDGFWVHTDLTARPRPYVPRNVATVPFQEIAYEAIAAPGFDPAEIAFVEAGEDRETLNIEGVATITNEQPGHITIKCHMQTPGVVVLNDIWYDGWQAQYNGVPVPVSRVNGALIGISAPAGIGTIELTYRPKSFDRGVGLLLAALMIMTVIGVSRFWRRRGEVDEVGTT